MHDGMQYHLIQGQGHESLKVRNLLFLKAAIYNGSWQMNTDS